MEELEYAKKKTNFYIDCRFAAILMLTTVVASAEVVSAAKVKVTWNGNGGKIGTANKSNSI